jgi:hypothetical protein
LNTVTKAVCFHEDGKVALVTLRLNIRVNSRINIPEPLMMKDRIPSSATHLEGLRRLIALLISAEIGAVGKLSKAIRSYGIID